MADHHQIAFGMVLCLALLVCGGCATIDPQTTTTGSDAPKTLSGMTDTAGEPSSAFHAKTAEQPPCNLPATFAIAKADLQPSRTTSGQQIVSRIVYVSCYGTRLKGKITRKVTYNGKTLISLPEDIDYRPGSWTLTAYIAIPPGARSGGYQLETQMQTGVFRLQETQLFEIMKK